MKHIHLFGIKRKGVKFKNLKSYLNNSYDFDQGKNLIAGIGIFKILRT